MQQHEGEEHIKPVETEYRVPLRQPVFKYIAESVGPVYRKGLKEAEAASIDGSNKNLAEFHASRLSRIMINVLRQYPDAHTLPEEPFLFLSQQDLAFLEKTIPQPSGAGERKLRQEMMSEVKNDFNSKKNTERIKSISQRVKQYFRRG